MDAVPHSNENYLQVLTNAPWTKGHMMHDAITVKIKTGRTIPRGLDLWKGGVAKRGQCCFLPLLMTVCSLYKITPHYMFVTFALHICKFQESAGSACGTVDYWGKPLPAAPVLHMSTGSSAFDSAPCRFS